MFNKKINCLRCGKKISKNFRFCPFCGAFVGKVKEPDSLLDELEEIEKQMRIPFFLKFPVKSMIKQLAKEFSEIEKETEEKEHPIVQGFSVHITTGEDGKPIIKVKKLGTSEKEIHVKETPKSEIKDFSKEDAKRFAKLKKIEPQTKVRRLADKIVYELEIPSVKKDKVIVNHLGNSIEIKALTKDKAYFKVIPVSLPIRNWYTEDNKLIIELEP